MPGKGLDVIPLRIPMKWDAVWFEAFVRDVLSLGDVRNAEQGTGIEVSGTSDGPATISATTDVEALTDAAFLLTAPEAALVNANVLQVESGVLEMETPGGGVIRIVVKDGGIFGTKLRPSVALSVMGNPASTPATAPPVDVVAGANGLFLQRKADALAFDKVTTDLVEAPTANRLYGRISGGAGPLESIELGTNLSFTGNVLNAAGGGGGGGTAATVSYVPTAPLTATNVQAALDEIAALLASAGIVLLGFMIYFTEQNTLHEMAVTYSTNAADGLRNFSEITFV